MNPRDRTWNSCMFVAIRVRAQDLLHTLPTSNTIRLDWSVKCTTINIVRTHTHTHTYSFLISKLYLRFSYVVLNLNHMSWNTAEYSFRLRSEKQIHKQTQLRDCFKNYERKNTLKIDKCRQKVERKYTKNSESYFREEKRNVSKSIREIITWFYS